MASNFQNTASGRPGSAQRTNWDRQWDGSSVDPVRGPNYDNITGTPINQSATAGPHKLYPTRSNVVMQQPVDGSHYGSIVPTANEQQTKLRDCWNDSLHLMNILLTDPNINNLVLTEKPKLLSEMLTEENPEKLFGWIQMFMNENLELVQEIYQLIKILKVQYFVSKLRKPELTYIEQSWNTWIRNSRKYLPDLRRLLEIFIIMQQQLKEAKSDLNEIVQPKVEPMDTSKDPTEIHDMSSEQELQQDVEKLQLQNHQLKDEKEVLQKRKQELQQEIEKLQLQKQNLKEEKEVLEKREQALLQEKENLHLQNRKLIEDNEDLEKRKQALLQENLHLQNRKLIKDNEDLEKRWTSAKDNTNAKENEQLRKQIAKLQRDLQSLKNEEKTWKSSLENLSSTISEMDKEKGTLENKVNVYEKERKNWIKNSNLIHEVSSKKDQWKFRYQQSEENAERLKLLLSSKTTELERKVKEIDELQKANIYLAKTKDDLLTRLSKFAGAKLTHGNADITDLSDANRPVKIAEKFSELYDNEWTDALEEIMTKNISEKTAIEINLKIVSSAYEFCSKASEQHARDLMDALFNFPRIGDELLMDKTKNEKVASISVPIEKGIEDIRRSLAPQLTTVAEERFCFIAARIIHHHLQGSSTPEPVSVRKQPRQAWGTTPDTNNGTGRLSFENKDLQEPQQSAEELMAFIDSMPDTKKFAKRCANLCWLMRIRDPKMHMIYEVKSGKGEEFDEEHFRHYTRTGKRISFLVWPVLCLYENGPVLSKGVAQPL